MTERPALSENAWQQQILDLATAYGWTSYHTFDSRHSAPGFPDLVLMRPPLILFVELKTDTGRLTPFQEAWLTGLRNCGLYAEVWRPANFDEAHRRLRVPGALPPTPAPRP